MSSWMYGDARMFDEQQQQGNPMIEEQIKTNNAQIEAQTMALAERRLGIIKSSTNDIWKTSQPNERL